VGPIDVRYCVCGATRAVPANLRIVGCVRCGRALTSLPEIPVTPSTPLAAVATFATQLLGAAMFSIVLAWAWSASAERFVAGGLLALGASWVFAAGSALRGSLVAVGYCMCLDVALAALVAADYPSVASFVRAGTASIAPAITAHVNLVCAIAGGVAVFAAIVWLTAIPHVRRIAAWHEAQIARLA
jgi:hypothetical protein